MKHLILALVYFWTSLCLAADPPVSLKGQLSATKNLPAWNLETPMNQSTKTGGINALIETGNFNLLANPGFEHSTYSTAWTASGGSSSVGTSTNIGTGLKSYAWDASASSQTLTSDAVAIPAGFYGIVGGASCRFKTSATDYLLQVYDGTNVVASQAISASTTFTNQTLNFNFPTSGNISLRIASQSNAAALYIDDCRLGPATNVGTVQQAQLLGTIKVTGCSGAWTSSSTTIASFSVNTGCTYTATGAASAPGTQIPAISFSQIPAGNLFLQAEGTFTQANTSNYTASFQFYDGTNSANEVSNCRVGTGPISCPGINQSISYSTTQSNVTLQIRTFVDSGGLSAIQGSSSYPLVIKVYWFPTSAQGALTQNTTPAYYNGYHENSCAWTVTATSYTDFPADASCALTVRNQSNISCSTVGSVLPAVACTLPSTGPYYICGKVSVFGGATVGHAVRIWDGTTTISEGSDVSTNEPDEKSLCGIYNATSLTPTISLQGQASSGSVTIQSQRTSPAVEWTIINLAQSFPAPLLIGSVTSNTSGLERIERATVNCGNSGSSVTSQSGNWVTISNGGGAGACTLNFSFTSTPTCSVTVERNPIPTSQTWGTITSISSTSAVLQRTVNAVDLNGSLQVICMGPR